MKCQPLVLFLKRKRITKPHGRSETISSAPKCILIASPHLFIYIFCSEAIRQHPVGRLLCILLIQGTLLCNVFLDICGSAASILSFSPSYRACFSSFQWQSLYITSRPLKRAFNSLPSFYNGTRAKRFDWLGGRTGVLIHFLPVTPVLYGSVLIG